MNDETLERIAQIALDSDPLVEPMDWVDLFDRAEQALGIHLPLDMSGPVAGKIVAYVRRACLEAGRAEETR